MDVVYNNTIVTKMDLAPTTTIGQLKSHLYNWLTPQGITIQSIELTFGNGTQLNPIVFTSNTYDKSNFEGNVLTGGTITITGIAPGDPPATTQVTQTALRAAISEIVAKGDLSTLTYKQVARELVEKFGTESVTEHKPFIKSVMVEEASKKVTQQQPAAPMLGVVDYSDKTFIVYGEATRTYKNQLKNLGGKFNKYLKQRPGFAGGAAWVFTKKLKPTVYAFVNQVNSGAVPQTAPTPTPATTAPTPVTTAPQRIYMLLDTDHCVGIAGYMSEEAALRGYMNHLEHERANDIDYYSPEGKRFVYGIMRDDEYTVVTSTPLHN